MQDDGWSCCCGPVVGWRQGPVIYVDLQDDGWSCCCCRPVVGWRQGPVMTDDLFFLGGLFADENVGGFQLSRNIFSRLILLFFYPGPGPVMTDDLFSPPKEFRLASTTTIHTGISEPNSWKPTNTNKGRKHKGVYLPDLKPVFPNDR